MNPVKQFINVLVFVSAISSCSNIALAQEQAGENEIVARVNGRAIFSSTYRQALREFLDEIKEPPTVDQQQEHKLRQQQVLQSLIELELLTQRAEALSLKIEPAELDHLLRISSEVCTLSSLDQIVRHPTMANKEETKTALRQRLLASAVLRQEVYQRISQQLSETQKRGYYERHQEEFVSPGEVTLSVIRIPIGSEKAGTLQRALAFVTQLRSDINNFPNLVAEEKLEVHQLGAIKLSGLDENLRVHLGNAPVGTITGPIQNGQWIAIYRLEHRQEPLLKPLEDSEVQRSVTEGLIMELGQLQTQLYLDTLRRQAVIQINPKYR